MKASRPLLEWRDWFTRSHAVDWAATLAVALVDVLLAYVLFPVPFQREIIPGDPELSFKLLPDTVPIWLVGVIVFISTVCVHGIVFYFERDMHALHAALLSIAQVPTRVVIEC
jgi:hypothetical protein